MAMYDDDPEHDYLATGNRRCRASRRNNAGRCGQPAMSDQWICRLHGGSSPNNRDAAEKRALEREAQKLLGKWTADPTPVSDPIGSLARMAGQAESLKDMAYRATEPRNECLHCGRDETDPAAFMAFVLVARQLTQMLTSIDKIGLRDRIIEHSQQQLTVLLAALNDAMTEMFPEVDATRVLLQKRFLERVAYWEQNADDLPGMVRAQSHLGENPTFGRDTSGDMATALLDDPDDDWLG